MSTTTTWAEHKRDRATARTAAGIRLNAAQHWATRSVHAFRRWTGETTAETWCGQQADFGAADRQTIDLISCLSCSEASWRAFQATR
jgi:hypothetical protein